VQFADDEEVTATVSRLFGARGILHPAPQAGNTLKHKKGTHLGALLCLARVDKKDASCFYSAIRHLIDSAIT
jgi:hypothetical protein